ncbi:hypothetical protein ACFQV2_37235 [Actinokineospora soli]|uniref:Uncharacterized protein n=1 Tax=Actinokineospora soli TaxID=1048753 RepID=A0ABW2U0C6_9PSEU
MGSAVRGLRCGVGGSAGTNWSKSRPASGMRCAPVAWRTTSAGMDARWGPPGSAWIDGRRPPGSVPLGFRCAPPRSAGPPSSSGDDARLEGPGSTGKDSPASAGNDPRRGPPDSPGKESPASAGWDARRGPPDSAGKDSPASAA